jgi:hypothetical protein
LQVGGTDHMKFLDGATSSSGEVAEMMLRALHRDSASLSPRVAVCKQCRASQQRRLQQEQQDYRQVSQGAKAATTGAAERQKQQLRR